MNVGKFNILLALIYNLLEFQSTERIQRSVAEQLHRRGLYRPDSQCRTAGLLSDQRQPSAV